MLLKALYIIELLLELDNNVERKFLFIIRTINAERSILSNWIQVNLEFLVV